MFFSHTTESGSIWIRFFYLNYFVKWHKSFTRARPRSRSLSNLGNRTFPLLKCFFSLRTCGSAVLFYSKDAKNAEFKNFDQIYVESIKPIYHYEYHQLVSDLVR